MAHQCVENHNGEDRHGFVGQRRVAFVKPQPCRNRRRDEQQDDEDIRELGEKFPPCGHRLFRRQFIPTVSSEPLVRLPVAQTGTRIRAELAQYVVAGLSIRFYSVAARNSRCARSGCLAFRDNVAFRGGQGNPATFRRCTRTAKPGQTAATPDIVRDRRRLSARCYRERPNSPSFGNYLNDVGSVTGFRAGGMATCAAHVVGRALFSPIRVWVVSEAISRRAYRPINIADTLMRSGAEPPLSRSEEI